MKFPNILYPCHSEHNAKKFDITLIQLKYAQDMQPILRRIIMK